MAREGIEGAEISDTTLTRERDKIRDEEFGDGEGARSKGRRGKGGGGRKAPPTGETEEPMKRRKIRRPQRGAADEISGDATSLSPPLPAVGAGATPEPGEGGPEPEPVELPIVPGVPELAPVVVEGELTPADRERLRLVLPATLEHRYRNILQNAIRHHRETVEHWQKVIEKGIASGRPEAELVAERDEALKETNGYWVDKFYKDDLEELLQKGRDAGLTEDELVSARRDAVSKLKGVDEYRELLIVADFDPINFEAREATGPGIRDSEAVFNEAGLREDLRVAFELFYQSWQAKGAPDPDASSMIAEAKDQAWRTGAGRTKESRVKVAQMIEEERQKAAEKFASLDLVERKETKSRRAVIEKRLSQLQKIVREYFERALEVGGIHDRELDQRVMRTQSQAFGALGKIMSDRNAAESRVYQARDAVAAEYRKRVREKFDQTFREAAASAKATYERSVELTDPRDFIHVQGLGELLSRTGLGWEEIESIARGIFAEIGFDPDAIRSVAELKRKNGTVSDPIVSLTDETLPEGEADAGEDVGPDANLAHAIEEQVPGQVPKGKKEYKSDYRGLEKNELRDMRKAIGDTAPEESRLDYYALTNAEKDEMRRSLNVAKKIRSEAKPAAGSVGGAPQPDFKIERARIREELIQAQLRHLREEEEGLVSEEALTNLKEKSLASVVFGWNYFDEKEINNEVWRRFREEQAQIDPEVRKQHLAPRIINAYVKFFTARDNLAKGKGSQLIVDLYQADADALRYRAQDLGLKWEPLFKEAERISKEGAKLPEPRAPLDLEAEKARIRQELKDAYVKKLREQLKEAYRQRLQGS